MKKIRLKVSKIKNNFYMRIPSIISDKLNLSNGLDLEVTIHGQAKENQVEIWDLHPEDINEINLTITEDVHTMNMYNRIYIPEKYRFFFPAINNDFILTTNVGNIKTHLTSNGYFTKGLRQWFAVNGPIMPNDKIKIELVDESSYSYQLNYLKG
ncbi:MAG: hypothetical protein CMG01_05660 [Candidatus Marinimicrobia bacterium]|nr:hypothetical protein [Candidatus Neomarinimicrobiota bacterium]|tara:strand:- start:8395 stop:8856 length:462 start_codon:yes stop_codon:yes gene_type:complete